jgi:hypothetical protein
MNAQDARSHPLSNVSPAIRESSRRIWNIQINNRRTEMKGSVVKSLAGALLLAGSVAIGAGAYAADSKPAASDAKTKCEAEAKAKNLAGDKAAEYVKKCEAEAAKPKK